MATIMSLIDKISDLFSAYVVDPITRIDWRDGIDIVLLAIILYLVLKFIRDRRAWTLFVGFAALGGFYFITWLLDLRAVYTVLHAFSSMYMVFIIVIFQREIRDALEKIGGTILQLRHIGMPTQSLANVTATIGVLSEAACDLSREKCGALIVVERNTKLGDYIKTGIELDAQLSCELLGNLFFNRSPLHDGAVIVRDGKIAAAGCILPSSKSSAIPKELGTRHRAAVGISEQSDAVVIVVSEETGTISIANNGILKRDYNSGTLKDDLFLLLTGSTATDNERILKSFGKPEDSSGNADAQENE
ncbi:MAG: TIGR00159 family protein [Ruminococcaceae bacterium]|nr:TIGR00159 family protein [Oscillospiraceae bacterium]